VLSGEIGGDTREDNAKTVLLYLQQPTLPDARGRVDRVRITGGDSTGTPRAGAGLRGLGYSDSSVFAPARLDITGCVIDDNVAGGQGAGIYLNLWQGRLEDTRIERNRSGLFGGGMDLIGPAEPSVIAGCVFRDNSNGIGDPTAGGGLRLSSPVTSGSVVIERSAFIGNTASGPGGGLSFMVTSTASPGVPEFVVRDTLIAGNRAGGPGAGAEVRVYRPPSSAVIRFEHCTVVENESLGTVGGSGIQARQLALIVRNSIVWGNLGGEPAGGDAEGGRQGGGTQIFLGTAATGLVRFSCVEGGFVGDGNIDADPGFVDAAAGDYTLSLGSALVDAGDSAGASDTDLSGQPRLVNTPRPDTGAGCPVVDMGAYERQEVCVADWNEDCRTDFVDVARYLNDWGAQAGAADLDADGAWTFFDVSVFVGALLGGC
jgi:hypothetical protein